MLGADVASGIYTPSKSSDSSLLTRKRGVLKGRLTNLEKYLDSFTGLTLTSEQIIEIKLRAHGASSLLNEFNTVQSQIEELSEELTDALQYRESFETKYYSLIAKSQNITSIDESANNPSCANLSSVKLPTITLPSFNGSYDNWLQFRDTYLSLVHNSTQISAIQKFHYLKSSLEGSAGLVIESLEFSAQNYSIAWELLTNRYDNTQLLIHNHIKALFSLQPLTKESPAWIRKLIDTIMKNLRALNTLGEPTDSWDTLIIYMVVSKLDAVTEREWEQHKVSTLSQAGDSKPGLKVDDLLKFLGRKADMLETVIVTHKNKHSYYNTSHTQNTPKVHCNVSSSSSSNKAHQERNIHYKPCPVCNNKHAIYSCQRFLDMPISDKYNIISQHKICVNCLRSGHAVTDCRFGPCKKCTKKHNSILHQDGSNGSTHNNTSSLVTLDSETHQSPVATENNSHTFNINTICETLSAQSPIIEPVLLSTAVIELVDKHNNYVQARALLDSGSQRCFITKALCEQLNASIIQSTHTIKGVGNAVTQSTQTCDITIRSLSSSYTADIKCLVLQTISSDLPSTSISIQEHNFKIPDNIQLADPKYFMSQPIDMLIGADYFWDLLEEGKIRLANGPFLQNTKLGWIISGPIYNSTHHDSQVHCNFTEAIDTSAVKSLEIVESASQDLPEIKSQTTQSYHASDNNNWFPFERYSQFNRMKRSFAYLMRFIHNTRNKNNKRTGALSVEELNESQTKLTKISQQESFPSVYETLSKQETLKKFTQLIKVTSFS
ncbi:uncharacterized protein LOC119693146 isoform X1 [Plutella xylostella]|uniref:uncharacterized protein LOC119693146 isoform X1 n=1 Tax=Plutella xylostella TaxID=51655 RepID=UPI0020326C47|nr:uncharacterized protein LOC119693146 isoform X1 [Plutella xylostella]